MSDTAEKIKDNEGGELKRKKGERDTGFLTKNGSEEWQGQKPEGDGRKKKGRKSGRANGVFKSFSTFIVFSYPN